MPKHRIRVTQHFHIPAEIEFEVEFDPVRGEAEVVSHGTVCAHPDGLPRREIIQSQDFDALDRHVYLELLEQGKLPIPAKGEPVLLWGQAHLPHEDYDGDPAEDLAGFVDSLEATDSRGFPRRRVRRRRRRVR